MLSLTTPGVQSLAAEDAVELARSSNDRVAEAVHSRPDRFQGFATLPTPVPHAAAQELERAICELGLHGAMVFGRTRDRNFDHPDFWPIFEAASALKVPLYMHPQSPQNGVIDAYYIGFGEAVDSFFARQPEPQAAHVDGEDLGELWAVLELEEKTRVRDRAIISVLLHGLRASEASALNVGSWNGKILMVHRSKGQIVSEVPLSREARLHLEMYLEWRQQQGEMFEPLPESPMFLAQDPKSAGKRLGYKGLHKMVKKLGAISGVENLHPHRFRHSFGTEVTRRGVDPLFGKELMGIKSDQVFQRYTKGVFKQAAAEAYLKAIRINKSLEVTWKTEIAIFSPSLNLEDLEIEIT